MKKAAIISIGTEIMNGKIDDTNSTFISRWLSAFGIIVELRLNVGDYIEDIINALKITQKSDIVILTGGLGPTEDDCTRGAFAKFLNKELVFQENEWQWIMKFFINRTKKVPESNKKQAMLISGGEFIQNELGTASGIFYKDNKTIYVLLPGPPNENQKIIKDSLSIKFIENGLVEGDIYTKIIRLYGVGESEIADLFENFDTSCNMGYYFNQTGWIELHISKYGFNKNENIKEVEKSFKIIKKILNQNNIFYTENKDISLLLLNLLNKKNLKIAFAESITGGNLSGEFIKNTGASNVFLGGIIAYSNQLKKDLLNVSDATLIKYGAVSEQTVKEMVIGLKKHINAADICVSISGIAGPTGASKDKPIGLVYFGFMLADKLFIRKEIFLGSRIRIINKCINYVLIEIMRLAHSNC